MRKPLQIYSDEEILVAIASIAKSLRITRQHLCNILFEKIIRMDREELVDFLFK